MPWSDDESKRGNPNDPTSGLYNKKRHIKQYERGGDPDDPLSGFRNPKDDPRRNHELGHWGDDD